MAESRNIPAAPSSREASHTGEANTAASAEREQTTTAGYVAGKGGFPLVSLDQVTDERLRRVLAEQAASAQKPDTTVSAEAVSEVLQVAAADRFILYLTGVNIIGPTKASIIACIEPVAATVCAILFLSVDFGFLDLLGFICIISTIFIVAYFDKKTKKK